MWSVPSRSSIANYVPTVKELQFPIHVQFYAKIKVSFHGRAIKPGP